MITQRTPGRGGRNRIFFAVVASVIVLGVIALTPTTALASASTPPRHTSSSSSSSTTVSSSRSSSTTSSTTTSSSSSSSSTSTSSSLTFVKTYANIVGTTQEDVTPADVQSTSDGGYVILGQSPTSAGLQVSWLVKTDSSGNPQWEKEVGCFSGAPGDYSLGVSVQQTTDGGYVIGGGAVGCGSTSVCPSGTIQCAIVEKLSATGAVTWAYVYTGSSGGSYINQIRPTSDGGYIAVGGTVVSEGESGALILKLSSTGTIQWQETIGPSGSAVETFNAVAQTSDGGYAALGSAYSTSNRAQSILLFKFSSTGSVQWEDSYSAGTETQSPDSLTQTSDGGYLIAGSTTAGTPTGYTGVSYLLLKLDSSGDIQWQEAYNGGSNCNLSCTRILGGVVYSVHQTSGGDYLVAGDGDIPVGASGEGELVPWAAEFGSSGNLVWQHLYYQVYKPTGLPLSEYFAASALNSVGGLVAVGSTENYASGLDLLFVVSTDSSGLCGANCGDIYSAVSLNAINPGLTASSTSLPVSTTTAPYVSSPSTEQATSVSVATDCE